MTRVCVPTLILSLVVDAAAVAANDLHGDPLPSGAVARLGTVRYRHPGPEARYSVVFSPDGKVVVGTHHDAIVLWDAATGRELRQLRTFADGGNDGAAYSPDGKYLATTNYHRQFVFLWDLSTGKELWRHGLWGGPVAFSPDGKTVAAGCYGVRGSRGLSGDYIGVVYLWDVATGKELRQYKGHAERILAIAFSPDGQTLASASGDHSVRLWSVASGQELRRCLGHQGFVQSVAFAPDGKTLASAGENIRLWDAATGRELRRLVGHSKVLRQVAYLPDGKTLISSAEDRTIRHWDLATGREIKRFGQAPIRTDNISLPIALSPDGKWLAGPGLSYNVLCLWDTATGRQVNALPAHETPIHFVAVAGDGRNVATGSFDDEKAHLWDLETGRLLRTFPGHTGGIAGLACSSMGSLLAATSWQDGRVALWDAATGKPQGQVKTTVGNRNLNVVFYRRELNLALAPDGRTLATGDPAGTIELWEPATGKRLAQFQGHPDLINRDGEQYGAGPATTLLFSPDGRTLINGNNRVVKPGKFFVRQATSGRVVQELSLDSPPQKSSGRGESLAALSPDGQQLAVMDWAAPGSIQFLEVPTGRLRQKLPLPGERFQALALSPDNRVVAVGDARGLIRLWDLVTGEERGQLPGHQGPILDLAFTPDGRRLISGSADLTALVWDIGSRPALPRLSAALQPGQQQEAWATLANIDAGKAWSAMKALLADRHQTGPFLADRLQPIAAPDKERVAALVADLDSEQFAVRQAAEAQLEKLGELAGPALQQVLNQQPSLEVRRRIQDLQDRINGGRPSADALRQARAVEVLEHVGTPEARQVLEKLARGAPSARLTREARAVLDRLDRLDRLASSRTP
jgi:WD40 repeat protein